MSNNLKVPEVGVEMTSFALVSDPEIVEKIAQGNEGSGDNSPAAVSKKTTSVALRVIWKKDGSKEVGEVQIGNRIVQIIPQKNQFCDVLTKWLDTAGGAGACAGAFKKLTTILRWSDASAALGTYGKVGGILGCPGDIKDLYDAIQKNDKAFVDYVDTLGKGSDVVEDAAMISSLCCSAGFIPVVGTVAGVVGAVPNLILAVSGMSDAQTLATEAAKSNAPPIIRTAIKTQLCYSKIKFAAAVFGAILAALALTVLFIPAGGASVVLLHVGLALGLLLAMIKIGSHYYKNLAPYELKLLPAN